jgi:hypothetical protein
LIRTRTKPKAKDPSYSFCWAKRSIWGGIHDFPHPVPERARIGHIQTGQNLVAVVPESGQLTDAEVNVGEVAIEGHPNDLLQRRRRFPTGVHRREFG